MKRIGLLGGSFDPVHAGHLQLAHDALTQIELDEVRFVVAANPWQKTHVSAPTHRLRMVEIALANAPDALRRRCAIERCELTRTGISYTIETVIELRARYGPDACLVLVMGSDQWRNLGTWHRHAELTDYANIAVARRGARDAHTAAADLPPTLAVTAAHGQIVSFPMTPHPAAATDIRAALRAGVEVGDLLPAAVLAYIRTHHLYEQAP